jgi:flagellar motor switch protein FliG
LQPMSHPQSLHKAAVLIASLDADTADLLLAQIPDDQADVIRQEVFNLRNLDPAEQQAIIEEFFHAEPQLPQTASPEIDDEAPAPDILPFNNQYSDYSSAPANFEQNEHSAPQSGDATFAFLHDAEPESLVPLLEHEHPQAVALVLTHLPHHRAGHVLARLPATIQTDVVRRLVDCEPADPDVLRDVAKTLEVAFINRQSERRTAGMATIASILNASDSASRRQILNNLAVHDRPLAHRLTAPPPVRRFTFAEVCQFPVEALLHLLELADRRTVTLALADLPDQLVDPILDELDPDLADWITHGIQHIGPLRLSDFDRAKHDLAEFAQQLYAEGKLPGFASEHLIATA